MARTTITSTTQVNSLGTTASSRTKAAKQAEEKRIQTLVDYEYAYREKRQRKFEANSAKEEEKLLKKTAGVQARLNKELAHAEAQERQRILYETASSFKKLTIDTFKAAGITTSNTLKDSFTTTVSTITNKLSNGMNDFLNSYSQYMSGIETRLYGSGKTYKGITKMIGSNIGASQYVTQSKMYENLSKLVAEGISYNVEQRAFLQTISEKIATTFDAANGTLVQLIRIQQADSTAARLGVESRLTQFFNSNFGDTSYLNGLSKSVSASILGANSQLSRDESLAFEYNVQKWLGSLSSVGVNDATIQSLAQGLNYLGTGDVTSLTGNTSLQNLLIMAANRAGLDYSSMLINGLGAKDVNSLLRSVVSYGQEIASNNNKVVRAQYANLFGITLSDLTAIMNLTSQDLVTISKNMLDYSGAIAETEHRLSTISSRTSVSERVQNLYDNVMSSVGENIANNAVGYTTWLINDLIEQATGGINIPFISALGNGVDVNANVNQLIKLGIVGISTLAEVGNILGGLTGQNNLSIRNWNSSDTTTRNRGTGFTVMSAQGISRGNSEVKYTATSDGNAMYEGSIAAAKESAQATSSEEEPEMIKIIRDSIDKNILRIKELLEGTLTVTVVNMPTGTVIPGGDL